MDSIPIQHFRLSVYQPKPVIFTSRSVPSPEHSEHSAIEIWSSKGSPLLYLTSPASSLFAPSVSQPSELLNTYFLKWNQLSPPSSQCSLLSTTPHTRELCLDFCLNLYFLFSTRAQSGVLEHLHLLHHEPPGQNWWFINLWAWSRVDISI